MYFNALQGKMVFLLSLTKPFVTAIKSCKNNFLLQIQFDGSVAVVAIHLGDDFMSLNVGILDHQVWIQAEYCSSLWKSCGVIREYLLNSVTSFSLMGWEGELPLFRQQMALYTWGNVVQEDRTSCPLGLNHLLITTYRYFLLFLPLRFLVQHKYILHGKDMWERAYVCVCVCAGL